MEPVVHTGHLYFYFILCSLYIYLDFTVPLFRVGCYYISFFQLVSSSSLVSTFDHLPLSPLQIFMQIGLDLGRIKMPLPPQVWIWKKNVCTRWKMLVNRIAVWGFVALSPCCAAVWKT